MDEDVKHESESIARRAIDLPKQFQELRDIYKREGERALGLANALDERIELLQRAGTVYSVENLERLKQSEPELFQVIGQAVTSASNLCLAAVEAGRVYEITQIQSASTTSSVAVSGTAVADFAFTVSERLGLPTTTIFQQGSLDR